MNANMQELFQNIVTMSLSSKQQEQIKQNVQIFNLFHSKRRGNMFVKGRRNKSRQNGKTRQNGNNRLTRFNTCYNLNIAERFIIAH